MSSALSNHKQTSLFAAVPITHLHPRLFSHSPHTLSLIMAFSCFRPLPLPPIFVTQIQLGLPLRFAPVQPLHFKCLACLLFKYIYTHTHLIYPFLFSFPDTSDKPFCCYTASHSPPLPLMSLTTQIHFAAFQSSTKLLPNNAGKHSLQHQKWTKFNGTLTKTSRNVS